jgi:hypothetical protein
MKLQYTLFILCHTITLYLLILELFSLLFVEVKDLIMSGVLILSIRD